MSYQVGSFCYASVVDAAGAACSRFVPVTSQNGNTVSTTSCTGVDASGNLLLSQVSTDITTNVSTTMNFSQMLSFPPCSQGDVLTAFETIASPFLLLIITIITGKKILAWVGWNRGDV